MAYEVLTSNGIPIPRIIQKDKDKLVIVQERLLFKAGIESHRQERIRSLASIIRRIHQIEPMQTDFFYDRRFPLDENFSNRIVSHFEKKYIFGLERLGFELRDVNERLSDFYHMSKPKSFRFVHGDCKLRHYFFNKGFLKGIIDFEYSSLFDYRTDIGSLLADLYDFDPKGYISNSQEFIKNYGLEAEPAIGIIFYMVASKLVQALNIDVPLKRKESIKRGVYLANHFARWDNFKSN